MALVIPTIHGKKACSCMVQTIPIVEKGLRELGIIVKDLSGLITQGAYNKGVGASAGSHDKGGVWDVSPNLVNTEAKRRVWFDAGFIPFYRLSTDFRAKVGSHGHVVQVGCPHRASLLITQELAARKGRNGMANNGPFRGTVPFIRDWEEAVRLAKPVPKPSGGGAAKPSDNRPPFSLANVHAAMVSGKPDGNVKLMQIELNKHYLVHRQGRLAVDGIWGKNTQRCYDAYRRLVIKYKNESDNIGKPGTHSAQHLMRQFKVA